jgi:Transposase, Mutator family
MIDTWDRAWAEFTPFLAFPVELRTIMYTTNAIESLNARFRKAIRHRGHFPNEQSALKVLFLVATERKPNRSNPTGRDCPTECVTGRDLRSATERRGLERITTDDFHFCSFFSDRSGGADVGSA